MKGFETIRIYCLEASNILRVVRILHGKRNVRRIFKQERIPEEQPSGRRAGPGLSEGNNAARIAAQGAQE